MENAGREEGIFFARHEEFALFISRFFLSNAFPFCFITLRNSYHVSDVVSSIDKNVVRDYNYTMYSVQINFEEFKILSGL